MSRSWKLYNVDTGDQTLVRGRMTVRLTEGSVEELNAPLDVVQQRVGKCTIEPSGSNRFSDNWGSVTANLIGQKLSPPEIAREIGTNTRQMIDGLIVEQARTPRSIPLDPRETIVSLGGTTVSVADGSIGVQAHVVVGDGTVATSNATVAA